MITGETGARESMNYAIRSDAIIKIAFIRGAASSTNEACKHAH